MEVNAKMYGWEKEAEPPEVARKIRLIVFPSGKVGKSVRAEENVNGAHKQATDAGVKLTTLDKHGARIKHTHKRVNCVIIEVDRGREEELKRELERDGHRVERAQTIHPLLNDSVPLLQVPPIWNLGYTGKGVKVAVVDTGVDPEHPDLSGKIVAAKDFTGTRYQDDVGHGTHVAGIIAGAGTLYRGVAPDVQIIAARVLTRWGGYTDDVLAGISWAVDQGAKVINLSLGGPGSPSDVLSMECNTLMSEGIVVCVAAGNSGPEPGTIDSPGCAELPITVGAVDKDRALTFYSSRGPVYDSLTGKTITKPDILACGGGYVPAVECPYDPGITSTKSSRMRKSACTLELGKGKGVVRYEKMSGTSMACPHVAGVAALLLQAMGTVTAESAARIKEVLILTAIDIGLSPNEQGTGIIIAEAALSKIS